MTSFGNSGHGKDFPDSRKSGMPVRSVNGRGALKRYADHDHN